MVENVVGDAMPEGDPFGFVKMPMNPKINATLAVFFFGLGKGRKTARPIWTHVAIVIFGCSVEFIRDKREGETIGAIKSAHYFE